MYFEIIGSITNVETIAVGSSIRELDRLKEQFGAGRWRKLKGMPRCNLMMARFVRQKFIGMKPTALAKEK